LERLRHIREQAGYSQQDLADEAGVSQHTISEIELGRRKPQGRTLRKLAEVLGVEVGDFFLLERAQDAARQDEKKEAQAVNRLIASEGALRATSIANFEEDRFRAELRALGFPDEHFEDFIWPLVTTVNKQDREISRLREENSRLKKEAEQESVHR